MNLLTYFVYKFFILFSVKLSNFIIFEFNFLLIFYSFFHFLYLHSLILPLLLLYQFYSFLFYSVVLYMWNLLLPLFLNFLYVYIIHLYLTFNCFYLLFTWTKKYILTLSKILLNDSLSFGNLSYFLNLLKIFFLLLFDSKPLSSYINLLLLLFLNFLQSWLYLLLIVPFINFIRLLYRLIKNFKYFIIIEQWSLILSFFDCLFILKLKLL